MAGKTKPSITMRVRVGDRELEVTGPQEFVENKIDEFLKKTPSAPTSHSSTVHATKEPIHSPEIRKMSAAQLFKKSGLKTATDRVLLAAYYREKMQNTEDSTAAEIRQVIRDAKRPPPTNTNDAINQNIKKGYLMTAGDRDNKMAFVVTSDGEEAVEEMLSQKNN